MSRGSLDFIAENSVYQDSEKKWYVELIRSEILWYDLLVSPPDVFDTAKYYSKHLSSLKETVAEESDRRFIYFLAARTKIRFSLRKKAKYSLLGDKFIFYIEIGREKLLKRIKVDIPIRDFKGKVIKAPFELEDRFILFHFPDGINAFFSIYEFLMLTSVHLGIDTEIHYVGYTKNPSVRAFNGEHRGLSHMFYKYSSEEYDFFIIYNLFKVNVSAKNNKLLFNFHVSNSLLDEIKVDEEGQIIEKALIYYFHTEIQEKNRTREKGELKNKLIELSSKHHIRSISIHIEIEEKDECYRFFSSAVPASDKHIFTCTISNNHIDIKKNVSEVDIVRYMME